MAIYDHYARVYDNSGQISFSVKMIPYLADLMARHRPPGQRMLDLACGTGTVALSFAEQGWEVYGVDGSAEMLAQARAKAGQVGHELALSQQDMRSFVLPHSVALITCLYDSLNYMLTLSDLEQVFGRVSASLVPGGVFMADMNTQIKLEEDWGDNTFFIEGDEMALIMRSRYDRETRLSAVEIVGFVRQEDGLYWRFDEEHTEIAHKTTEVQKALERTGLEVEAFYGCFSFEPPNEQTRRIMWVARKRTGQ